ncbi:B-block binding subunit of TFIIIC [Spatholobus suberectus]|nr:B-block binding subunit of TFIIIC [Spatholobus suberectus]
MDSIMNAAVEEICGGIEDGVTLAALWAKLEGSPSLSSSNLHLSPTLKRAIWTNLLRIPTLRFEPQPSSSELEDAENLNLKIFAQQSLADNFVGLYDSQSLQHAQMRVLHLLANAKANGITQTQLAKHLHIDANNFHYVLRSLECQGLIVKHSAIEKKKQISTHGESKNYPCVTTHLVYLRRYAKQLASHQRFEFEITKFDAPDDDYEDVDGATLQTDVHLKDYTPQMKAICDKLAKANGKVLLVSGIKKDLGYCGSRPRQRAWRQISQRLKADGIVEQFDAKVNGKIEACLRLLDPITTGSGNEDKKLNSGKICQVIDQLVELPIEHQIFDIIDAAGSCGITLKEICDRLGIELKKNHIRLINLCYRFGMKVQEEQCLKAKTIRVWTSKNFNPEPEVELICKLDENKILDCVPDSSKIISEFEASITSGELDDPAKLEDRGVGEELSCVSPRNTQSDFVGMPTDLQDLVLDQRGTVSHCKLVSSSVEADNAPSGAFPSDVLKPFSTGSYQRYASLSFSVDNTRRANRILEKLKDERFILKPEINRWLNSFEKDKSTKVDRKTIDRILTKLQELGQVKCITVHSPVISVYSRTKDCVVVVHPSMNLSPELFDEIQDRVRSFNNYIRSKSTSYQTNDELIPVMEDIQKNQRVIVPDGQASKAEAMRANGFVLAKMIRAKLLHSFLWDCLHRSTSHCDALSSKKCVYELTDTPHSSSKLFSLEANIKEMPVELFLQVVGSTQKYEEMIEKCKMGLRLSDLPPEEYKCLMDAHATGRLSLVIDILRRLKLIRMVTDVQSRDRVKTPHTFTHAMELRPYIEEPISNDAASLNFLSLDLRPRVRHDFILSNRDAVDEYWQTLEYCYATADRKAASYAFPGSMVHELFRFRSWASTRLMTAEQRAELLKHVTKDNLSEKISYRDSEKIAKDLNLTLEQVLSMYSSKYRRHFLNQFKDEENEDNSPECKGNSSRRRKKKSTELRPAKHARIDAVTVEDMHIEEAHNLGVHSGECAPHMQEFEEIVPQDCIPLINQSILTKMKPTRQRRFIWSDKADRQLVIQYVKHRAVLGARYHRIDWTSISDLPASPSACMRRMNLLNSNLRFRKAVNRLCNMLSERYAKQLEKSPNLSLNKHDCKQFVRSWSCEGIHNNSSPDVEIQMTSLNTEAWDDFENKNIKTALDEILRCKMMAKLDASSQKVQLQYEGWSDANVNADGYESQENEEITSAIPHEIIQSHHGKPHTFSAQRSRRRRLDKKFTRFLNNMANVYGQVNESLAVSNAVELFKLVFLGTSTGPQAPNLLADILRRYSEHDLFAAFNYLREKKIMIGGTGNERFELSQQFLQSVSKSPFPFNTGKQAVKFSAWLKERGKDLTEVGANLAEDLQCGDIFHLFALVSLGELSISPCLPDNGVGEAEDLRSAKCKSDATESSYSDKAKKPKSLFGVEGEIISRREKGFPGIIISAHRTTISRADILNLFKDNDNNGQPFEGDFQLNIGQSSNYSLPDRMLEIIKSCDPISLEENHTESPWEAMAGYARRLLSECSNQEHACVICAEVFMVVYAAIQKAGDQGLSMGEISQVINLPGAEVDGLIVDALLAFGQVLKVNAYDTVRVVDTLYRHKYFLTPVSDFHRVVQPSSTKIIEKSDHTCDLYKSKERDTTSVDTLRERNTAIDNVHKVTILNLPHRDVDPENQACDRNEGCKQDRLGLSGVDHEKETLKFSSGELCVPILPWINGDGTINNIVYRGLRRHVLGIVMQNPGILEDDILRHMHVLNPQSCRTLLELMVLDKHLIVRKMHQNIFDGGPSVLQELIGSKSSQPKLICREHFFANPMSTSLL